MATEWFSNDGSGVAVHVDDENIALIGDYIPDWVLIPVNCTERAGEKMRVSGSYRRTCPKCKARTYRTLILEHSFHVSECVPNGCGFVLFKVKV